MPSARPACRAWAAPAARVIDSVQAFPGSLAQFVARQEAALVEGRAAALAGIDYVQHIIGCYRAGGRQPVAVGDRFLRGLRRQCLPLWQHAGGVLLGRFVSQFAGSGFAWGRAAGKAADQYSAKKDTKSRHLQLAIKDTLHSNGGSIGLPINQSLAALAATDITASGLDE